MTIKISDQQTHTFEFCLTAENLEAYGNELEGHPGEEGLLVTGTALRKDAETVHIAMSLEGTMFYPCARCLAPVPFEIHLDYADDYEAPVEQEAVDLVPFVEECLFIHEPYRVLCDEACKGLCPNCGANLNVEQCGCEAEGEIDPRMAALKALL